MGKPQFIIDSPDYCIKIDDFLPRYTSQSKYKLYISHSLFSSKVINQVKVSVVNSHIIVLQ